MICPKCNFEQLDNNSECEKCGIIFEKYFAHQALFPASDAHITSNVHRKELKEEKGILIDSAQELFFHVASPVNPFYFSGRIIVFLGIFFWGWKFILSPLEINYTGQSFMHLVNLPFHEAGHIIFGFFGQFIMMLGGSLGQLLMPLTCFLVILFKTRDTFGASVVFWWLGESCMDLAPYINDARDLKIMLLGGVTGSEVVDYHDWEFILRKLGWLRYDHALAQLTNTVGILLMLISFAWGGYILFKQYKNLGNPLL
jgi:hypothetical protein